MSVEVSGEQVSDMSGGLNLLLETGLQSACLAPEEYIAELTGDRGNRVEALKFVNSLCELSFRKKDEAVFRIVHEFLSKIYDTYFTCQSRADSLRIISSALNDVSRLIEGYVIQHENTFVDDEVCNHAPRRGEPYVAWAKKLIAAHPAYHHPLYEEFIPEKASVSDLAFFSIQETTLDPRFDDVLALLQIGAADHIKLTFAANFWDEMGNGEREMMHTNLFKRMQERLCVTESQINNRLCSEAIACGNLSMMLALHRHHFLKAVGYFGVTEYLVPYRFKHVIRCWERLGLSGEGARYYSVHSDLDLEHGDQWLREVIAPMIDDCPENAPEITRGILYRLNSSKRYLDTILNSLLESHGGGIEPAPL